MKDKIRETDFSPNELPASRWALLWDSYIHQWRILIPTSLLLALFTIPLFCLYFVASSLIGGLDNNVSSYASKVFAISFYLGLGIIPGTMILYVGLSGAFEINKRLAYLEGTLTTSVFFTGLKEHWKSSLLIGLVVGLFAFLAFAGSLYLLLFFKASHTVSIIGVILLCFLCLIAISTSFFYMSQSTIYSNSPFATFKNSFLFTLMRLPLNLAVVLFILIFPIGLLFINQWSAIAGMLFTFFLGDFTLLAFAIYANGVYDKYINSTYYPELCNKGLRKKED